MAELKLVAPIAKRCTKCGEADVGKFGVNRAKPDGLCDWCSDCNRAASRGRRDDDHRAKVREWCRKNPERRRHYRVKNDFKIDFDTVWRAQSGKCAACGESMDLGGRGSMSVAVDHDHSCCPGKKSCGKCVRGLLHRRCNAALGAVNDRVQLLRQLADFLEKKR